MIELGGRPIINIKKCRSSISILITLLMMFGVISSNFSLIANTISQSFDEEYHDSPGFSPTGLTWQWGESAYLWNADNESKKIYKIIPSDGNMIDKLDSPGDNPQGVTWDGSFLWNVDCDQHEIFKINPLNGSIISSIPSPSNESRGLTWDGSHLWVTDVFEQMIYKVTPNNGTIVHCFPSPGENPTGLTWDGQYLWNVDSSDKKVYMLQPDDGSIIYSFSIEWNEFPYGLTWHEPYLWNTDLERNRIYKIKINSTDNQPPMADFIWNPLNPEPGEYIYFNRSLSQDPDGNITHYYWDFDDDGEFEVFDDVNPYPKKWDSPGSYDVTLRVIDNGTPSFMDSITKTVTVLEENPPTVRIVSPLDEEVVDGSVTIQGTANDIDDTIKRIEVKIDDNPWKQAIGTTSWSYYWHTGPLNVSDGVHFLSVRSYNGVSYSDEEKISVILNNHKPIFVFQINGGISSFSLLIENKGDETAENITGSIDIFGGFFGFIHGKTDIDIALLPINQIVEVPIDQFLFGIGPLEISLSIKADNVYPMIENLEAFIIGPLIV